MQANPSAARPRRRVALLVLAALIAFGATACEKPRKKPVLTKDQMKRISEAILTEAPTPKTPLGARFGDKLELIGVDADSASVKAGGKLRLTWYWRCLKPVTGAWKIFVHFEKPRTQRVTFDHHAVDGLYLIEEWKAGEIIRYTQVLDIGARFPGGEAVIYTGVFDEQALTKAKKDIRLKVSSPGKAKVDSTDRLEILRVKVEGSKQAAAGQRAPQVSRVKIDAARAAASPAIDGKLDDPAWATARWTPLFRQPDGRRLDPKLRTRARLLWDDTALYVGFEVSDADITTSKKGRDATYWEEDAVEVYLDPGSDAKDYVELQFAPTGEIFDAHFSSHRSPHWRDAAKRLTIAGLEVRVTADGTVNTPGDTDKSWTVEAKIPFAGLPGVSGPPAEGSTWTLNLYRIDSGNPKSVAGMGALAPVGGDFHDLSRAALLTFAKSAPAAAAPAKAAITPKVVPPVPRLGKTAKGSE